MGGKARAVREERWKLVRLDDNAPELFDLADDIGESKNLAAEKPDVLARLSAAMDAWELELIAPRFLGSSAKPEDWGPGGANQKTNPKAQKKAKAN
jgi:hypothetical protein